MPWKPLHRRHNERDGVSNHRRLHCLLNSWSRRGSKKTSKLRVTGLCVGNLPVTGDFPAQKATNAENVSIWWRHRNFLHMAFWMESFDLPNPLHWRHMGAMASRVTGNSTDCSAVPSGKQVRRQVVHVTALCEGKPPVTSCSNKGPVMWKVYYFDYTEIHSWGTSHFSDGLFWWRICITELQGVHSYLLVVNQLTYRC